MTDRALAPKLVVRAGRPVEEYASEQFDCLIFAVGYEARSRTIPEMFVPRSTSAIGLRFGSHETASFERNLGWAEGQANATIIDAQSETTARRGVRESLQDVGRRAEALPLRIGLDVSSLSRLLIGVVLSEIRHLADSREVALVIFYSPAQFVEPSVESGPVVTFGSVVDELTGVGDTLKRGLALVIGLGYEPHLAMAAYQALDPTEVWLAVPSGRDDRYDRAVLEANREVLSLVPAANVLSYEVARPFDAFMVVESLVAGLQRDSSVVLLPFGPKVFATAMMLVGFVHSPEAGVWRVSAEQLAPIEDRQSSDEVASLEVQFGVSLHEAAIESEVARGHS